MKRLFALLSIAASLTGAAACRKPPAASTTKAEATPQTAATGTSGQPSQSAAPGQPTASAQAPAAKPMPAQLPAVLARVNGEAVTKIDFDRLIKNMEVGANQPIPAARRDQIFRKALDQLVTYTVLMQ